MQFCKPPTPTAWADNGSAAAMTEDYDAVYILPN